MKLMIILTRINFNTFLKKVKLVFTFFLLLSFNSFSQCKNVTASYSLPLGNKTINVIREEATNLAKLEALKKAFGASYQQTTSRQTIDTELNGVRNSTTSNKLNISKTKFIISSFIGFTPYFLLFSFIGNQFSDLIEIKEFQLSNILSFELILIFLILIILLLIRIFFKFK